MSTPDAVTINYWVKRGNVMVDASALDPGDPDHPYNQAVSQGADPEDFGIEHPLVEEFRGKKRGELIAEIIKLRREIDSRLSWGCL